jgi:hypothetical protein
MNICSTKCWKSVLTIGSWHAKIIVSLVVENDLSIWISPGVKQLGHEADHSPPTSAEVNNMWIYTSTPPYVFIV